MSEEITERYYVRRREFLNEDPDLSGFIIGIVEDTRGYPDDDPNRRWDNGEMVLDLADCQRKISFYFNMYTAAERANSLRKITLIAEVINAVRDGIALEVASRNARPVAIENATTEDTPRANTEPVTTEAVARDQVFTSHFVTLGL